MSQLPLQLDILSPGRYCVPSSGGAHADCNAPPPFARLDSGEFVANQSLLFEIAREWALRQEGDTAIAFINALLLDGDIGSGEAVLRFCAQRRVMSSWPSSRAAFLLAGDVESACSRWIERCAVLRHALQALAPTTPIRLPARGESWRPVDPLVAFGQQFPDLGASNYFERRVLRYLTSYAHRQHRQRAVREGERREARFINADLIFVGQCYGAFGSARSLRSRWIALADLERRVYYINTAVATHFIVMFRAGTLSHVEEKQLEDRLLEWPLKLVWIRYSDGWTMSDIIAAMEREQNVEPAIVKRFRSVYSATRTSSQPKKKKRGGKSVRK